MADRNHKRFRAFNREVLFATDAVVTLDYRSISFLKEKSLESERKRVRLCAHKDIQDPLHEMFIVHTKDTYVRPHKHLRCESFHVVEGRSDVVVFTDDGTIGSVIRLGDYRSGLPFYYRLEESCFHTVIIRSDVMVFHETKQGPFNPSETLFAPWAPDGDERTSRDSYLRRMALDVETFLEEQPGFKSVPQS
jgi:cupin fold WbuC family metalloprotein